MAVIVKTNRQKWVNSIKGAAGVAAYALAVQIKADSTKRVPYSGGSIQSAGGLRDTTSIERAPDGSCVITWDQVYALYQWFGVRADGTHRVHRYTTPGTGTQWVEKTRQSEGKKWAAMAQKEFGEALNK